MADAAPPSALDRQGSAASAAGNGSSGVAGEDPADAAYFSELLSYSLERLSKEPELLRADQDAIRRQIQDTAVERYRSFLSTAQCLADLRAQLAGATSSLDALGKDLPRLQAAADAFKQDAAAANARWAENRQLYSESLGAWYRWVFVAGGRGVAGCGRCHLQQRYRLEWGSWQLQEKGSPELRLALTGFAPTCRSSVGMLAHSPRCRPPSPPRRQPLRAAGAAGGAAADGHLHPQRQL